MTSIRRTLHGRRDLLAPAAAFPERYPCLLQSVVRGTPQARFDLLFAFPRDRLTLHAERLTFMHPNQMQMKVECPLPKDFRAVLTQLRRHGR